MFIDIQIPSKNNSMKKKKLKRNKKKYIIYCFNKIFYMFS